MLWIWSALVLALALDPAVAFPFASVSPQFILQYALVLFNTVVQSCGVAAIV